MSKYLKTQKKGQDFGGRRVIKDAILLNCEAKGGVFPSGAKDAVKYTEQSLTDAQKAQARTNIGAGSAADVTANAAAIAAETSRAVAAEGALQTMISNIDRNEMVVSWDGTAAPTVANIPAGVTVTYDGTDYTGTLAADSTTAGKIYLVSDGNGEYDRYTAAPSGSSYAWTNIGSTDIDLSDYAKEAELSQLDQEVNGVQFSNGFEVTFPANGTINAGTSTRDFALPAGKYNLSSVLSASHNINIYFKDSNGDSITITDVDGTTYTSVKLPPYESKNPFNFPTAVAQINFYAANAPSEDLTVSFNAQSINRTPGLIDRIETLESGAETMTGQIADNAEDIEDLAADVDLALNGSDKSNSLTKTFPANTAITKAGTEMAFSLPAGTYDVTGTREGENNIIIYFLDAEGNAVTYTDNRSLTDNNIVLPPYPQLNPLVFNDDVVKVAFYSPATPSTDVTVTFVAKDKNAQEGLNDKVDDLDDRVSDLEGGKKLSLSCTDMADVDVTAGYYLNGHHDSSDYSYFSLDGLKEGDIIVIPSKTIGAANMRFVDTYNGSTRVPGYVDETSYRRLFRVPSGVDKVYITVANAALSGTILMHGTFVDGDKPTPDGNAWTVHEDTLSANSALILPLGAYQVTKFQTYDAKCRFASFSGIELGQAAKSSKGAHIKVDATNVYVYIGTSATPYSTTAHGLTISSFLFVTLAVKVNGRGSLVLVSDSGTFTIADFAWGATNGDVSLTPLQASTDVTLSYASRNLADDVWVFGDSYISYSEQRETYYLNTVYGVFEDILFSGFSGASSSDCVAALMTYLQITKPKYIVWLAGMNDEDTGGAVSATWMDAVNFVLDVCANYGAKPILSTVPNVPSVLHTYKNAIVAASGKQYIDMADAVGAQEAQSTWNPSAALSNDETHPSALGAQLLAAQIMLDFPQINRSK